MRRLLLVVFTVSVVAYVDPQFGGQPEGRTMKKTRYSVIVCGAKGDGQHDDTAAFQRAIQGAFEAGGGVVEVPAGRYLIASFIKILPGVTLQGVWKAPHHQTDSWGTTLLATYGRGDEDATPLVTLSPSSAIRGVKIYYPEQSPFDIKPYPWAIEGAGMHGSVENVTLVNAYQGIQFAARHELHLIRNVYGCVLRRGIFIDRCTDIGRIENVHFNPHYWMRANVLSEEEKNAWGPVLQFMNANLDAFTFAHTDWQSVLNTFCYGFHRGYYFIQGESGSCNGSFVGIGADGGHYGVYAEASQSPGILITNGQFVTFSGDKPTEVVTTPDFRGVLQLSNCSFWGGAYRCALLQGPGHVSFHQCNFLHWGVMGRRGGPSPDKPHAIRAEAGNLSIQGCRFPMDRPHIFLGQNLRSAVVLGNHFTGKRAQITDKGKDNRQIGMNVVIP